MGKMHSVACKSCGYREDQLCGVGGQMGMSGDIIWTLVCDKTERLVDSPEDPEPCPLCHGSGHAMWNPEKKICPRCGKATCETRAIGLWD